MSSPNDCKNVNEEKLKILCARFLFTFIAKSFDFDLNRFAQKSAIVSVTISIFIYFFFRLHSVEPQSVVNNISSSLMIEIATNNNCTCSSGLRLAHVRLRWKIISHLLSTEMYKNIICACKFNERIAFDRVCYPWPTSMRREMKSERREKKRNKKMSFKFDWFRFGFVSSFRMSAYLSPRCENRCDDRVISTKKV